MGGNRYIGLHLVHELARRGHDVTVMNSHEVDTARRGAAPARRPPACPARSPRCSGRTATTSTSSTTTPPTRRTTSSRWSSCSRGRVQHFVFTSSSAVYRRSFVQPVARDVPHPRRRRPGPAQGLRRRQGAVRALPRSASTTPTGCRPRCLRVAHTLGPMSPLAVARPDLLRPPGGRPADPRARRGLRRSSTSSTSPTWPR